MANKKEYPVVTNIKKSAMNIERMVAGGVKLEGTLLDNYRYSCNEIKRLSAIKVNNAKPWSPKYPEVL